MIFRLHDLDYFLNRFAYLWRPQPFKEVRPNWCEQLPELVEALLALSDDEVERLERDNRALVQMLGRYVPDIAVLDTLCALPESGEVVEGLNEARYGWKVPGRKKQQIDAFSQAIDCSDSPVLEWCGGKGHLGRALGMLWLQPVETVEWNPDLCEEGRRLSQRIGLDHCFHTEDALDEETVLRSRDRHVVALHACGDLHRHLIHAIEPGRVKALDIAPCCYHLGRHDHYTAFNENLSLKLSRDDLRLSVTNSGTASSAQVKLRNREMAWKLGYDYLRRRLHPELSYTNMKPVEKDWLKLSFEDFCRQLAVRENMSIEQHVDWQELEQQGWQRQHEVMRLNLLGFAFRRAIEIWLVLDMVIYLQEQRYQISVREFCAKELTPRNILISARI